MKELTIIERIKLKSPKIFKKITNICIAVGAVGGALIVAPISLPVGIVTLSGYLVTIGVVGGAVSKLTVEDSTDAR